MQVNVPRTIGIQLVCVRVFNHLGSKTWLQSTLNAIALHEGYCNWHPANNAMFQYYETT